MTTAAVASSSVPMVFSGPSVRAIGALTKTVTRRLVRLPPWLVRHGGDLEQAWADTLYGVTPGLHVPCSGQGDEKNETVQRLRNPYGFVVGGPPVWIWVKETWRPEIDPRIPGVVVRYAADGERYVFHAASAAGWTAPRCARTGNVTPLYMPKWASRMLLRVTDVRAERLHAITEEDAEREGAPKFFDRFASIARDQRLTSGELAAEAPHRAGFAVLWDEINGDRALWKTNPWVWRIAFSHTVGSKKRDVRWQNHTSIASH